MPDGSVEPAGIGLKRNPGVCVAWTTLSYLRFGDGRGGILFRLGDPTEVAWYAEGRLATREEVLDSFRSGFPLLQEVAAKEGVLALEALKAFVQRALTLVPAA